MCPLPQNPQKSDVRILLVDDEPAVRDVLAALLRLQNFKVETASDGLDAWEKLKPDLGSVDVVVTDNQMPRMDGITLISSLRAANFPGKIVVFSSSLTAEKSTRLAALGVDAIVEKGMLGTTIVAEIARVATRTEPTG
jgi:CheY-like chemotaxis protein